MGHTVPAALVAAPWHAYPGGAAHVWQTVDAFTDANCPMEHGVHDAAVAVLKYPALQFVQATDPAGAYVPDGHGVAREDSDEDRHAYPG